MNISVMVSGSGTNLQRILEAIESQELKYSEVLSVVADRECKAIARAEVAGISTQIVRRSDLALDLSKAIPEETDYIVLAGFLSILPSEFINNWKNKIINIHPSLLPKYGGKGMYGMKVHKAVLSNHEKESGATVHFVTEGIDEGPIILQKAIPIKKDETPEWLAKKVHDVEYEILIEALQKLEDRFTGGF